MDISESYPSTRTIRRRRKEARDFLVQNDIFLHTHNVNNHDNINDEGTIHNEHEIVENSIENEQREGTYTENEEGGGNNTENEEGGVNNVDNEEGENYLEDEEGGEFESAFNENDADTLVEHLKSVTDDDEQFYLSILLFSFRFNLSNAAIEGLINLLKYALRPKKFNLSLYHLRKHFATGRNYDMYYYCNHCLKMLLSEKHVCGNTTCPGNVKLNVGMFSIFHLKDILQQKFLNPSFQQQRQYKNNRNKIHDENIEDVMDGQKWAESTERYGDQRSIVIGLSLDGVPIYNSTKRTIWPIWMVYYDIPPTERYKQNNMTLLGVSFGTRPIMNRFLYPVVKQISDSSITPITLLVGGDPIDFTVYCFNISADLPAKAVILNMHHYNGEFGCPYCTAPGRCNGRGSARYYPAEDVFPNRTHDDMILDGRQAAATLSCVNGIYGPTAISRLQYMKLNSDIRVEYMHGISGTMKRMLSLWFSSENHREPWYLGRVISEIDKRMLSLRLPSWITRPGRSISDHLLYWKAAERMNFLLYFGPYVLSDLLPPIYYAHFLQLHHSIRIFLQKSLSLPDLDKAEKQCKEFVTDFELLYSPRNCCPNIHYIWHYGDSVRRHGPLWVNSMFPYENANGALKSIVHSRFKPCLAIMNSVTLLQNVYERIHTIPSLSLDFYNLFYKYQPTLAAEVAFKVNDDNVRLVNNIHVSGKLQIHNQEEQCFCVLRLSNPTLRQEDVQYYRKIITSNHSWCCSTTNASNDSVTKFILNDMTLYGVVIHFAQHEHTIMALMAVLKPRRHPIWCPTTYRCFYPETDELAVISVSGLRDVQVSIILDDIIYTISKAIMQT
eukprot:Pompholyxophrys_sp_v1_NODE_50_length_3002_cov_18.682728.p1 type:complete len:838 gc:universal NODE_50_length_3002_cov_18.682728:311-2824(+)